MRKAQVAIEDSRFYEHGGIDLRGIVARGRLQRPGRRRPGRLDADPAVRQAHAASENALQRQRRGSAAHRPERSRRPDPQAPGAEVRDQRSRRS